MISFDEAALVLNKWRDETAPLDLVLADTGWLTVVSRCFVTDLLGFMVTVGNAPAVRISLGLSGAEFRYEDRRAKLHFINRDIDLTDAICALRIQFPTGAVALLIENQTHDPQT